MRTTRLYDQDRFMEYLRRRTPPEPEFHQAVTQVLDHVISTANETDTLREHAIIERLTEPDRMIAFRVTWEDDNGDVQVNRGYRIQFNSAIGPYKGGLRFHPSVNPSVLKFLAFEQTFKNALTGLPMGGGKGGADFDPKGRSDREIMRFCAAFMVELHRHIGPDTDVPAGDINVGPREIGYLFGSYRRITNEFEGALTGKGLTYGGSELRVEATGFGLLHFVCHMLGRANDALDGKTVAVSGAGNVATHAAEKAIEMGAKVITLSDSKGFIHDPDGVDKDKIDWVRRLKSRPGASLAAYADEFGAEWLEDGKPWCVPCDVALPCATQNELGLSDARQLLDNGCRLIAEGANMPLTKKALELVHDSRILLGPGKAANAGGVAVSGLEITQNQMRASRTRGDISSELHDIMKAIHDKCAEAGDGKDGYIDYSRGADIAAFRKLAKAMLAQGIS